MEFVAEIDVVNSLFNLTLFQSLLRVVNLRRYNGRILFVPAPGYEGFGDPVEQTTSCKPNEANNAIEGDTSNVCNDKTCSYSGPSVDEADLKWRSLNGPFVNAWISNIAFASEGVMIAPQAQVNRAPFWFISSYFVFDVLKTQNISKKLNCLFLSSF
jgi:hypothetical protein